MPDLPALVSVTVADPPELWADLGFAVATDVCLIGGVEFRLVGSADGTGVLGWAFDRAPASGAIDGVRTRVDEPVGITARPHPNGVSAIDHLVLRSSDASRTAQALADAGFGERKRRDRDSAGNDVDMRFFLAEAGAVAADAADAAPKVVIELVGPAVVDPSDERPARLWGLALTCDDLDATASFFGDRCTPPKDAVQPGRRISALRREAGSTVPLALMSPHHTG